MSFRTLSRQRVNELLEPLIAQRANALLERAFFDEPELIIDTDIWPIRMSAPTMEKSYRIAEYLSSRFRPCPEIYLQVHGRDVGEDVSIAYDQRVNTVECRLSASSQVKSLREMRKLKTGFFGWSHSHGDGGTFHSPTDDRNIQNLILGAAPARTLTFSDGSLTFSRQVAWTNSVVINNHREEPFGVIAAGYTPFKQNDLCYRRTEVPVQIVDGPAVAIDLERIAQEIDERVTISGVEEIVDAEPVNNEWAEYGWAWNAMHDYE